MSYIALARKWRPRQFSELIGQDHVTKALINSIKRDKLHHAYLFTGTRGIGKTSVARLLAKSLNCENGPTENPCLQCDSCMAIENGGHIDLIEIDGASKTRIEDTRELLENVAYAPTRGRFKIYLIDEVHMLSQHSFNALLKTLEEPPPHIKFLFATTDPQKLPITVLSRCLQFHLRELDEMRLSQHLQWILDQEKINYELEAFSPIAKAARGSVRDALSLLDQCIASGNGALHLKDVNECLGYTQQDYALQLLSALANGNIETVLTIRQQIGKEGGYYKHVLDTLLAHLHEISIIQVLSTDHADNPLNALSSQFTPEDSQLLYQIALKGTEDMPLAPTDAIGFEMILIRMHVFRPAPVQVRPNITIQESTTSTTTLQAPVQTVVPVEMQTPSLPVVNDNRPMRSNPQSMQKDQSWSSIISTLQLQGLAHNALEQTGFISNLNGVITLRTAKSHESLFTTSSVKRIEDALSTYYKEKIKLKIQAEDIPFSSPADEKKQTQKENREHAELALQEDTFFNQLQETFSAKIIKNSIEPVKDGL